MTYRFIKLNKAKCLVCNDILISPPNKPEKLITCNCGNLTIYGGATSLGRTGKKGTYENMSQWDFTGCPAVNTDTPIPPPGSKITAKELEERKRKLKNDE
jgi:hypothetical protein